MTQTRADSLTLTAHNHTCASIQPDTGTHMTNPHTVFNKSYGACWVPGGRGHDSWNHQTGSQLVKRPKTGLLDTSSLLLPLSM